MPVSSFSTAANTSFGYCRTDAFWDEKFDCCILIIRSIVSCMIVLTWLLVLLAGSESSFTLGDCAIRLPLLNERCVAGSSSLSSSSEDLYPSIRSSAMLSSDLLSSVSDTLGDAAVVPLGDAAVVAYTLGDADGLDSIFSRHLRSSRFFLVKCCYLTLFFSTLAKFAAAAIIASSGDADGCVMYLCLKNTRPNILFALVSLEFIFQYW